MGTRFACSLQLRATFSEETRCQLFTESLDESPQYEALSYVWGKPNNVSPILLNGRVWNVTADLELALRHLRRYEKGEHRTLWVDALCINQGDILERNQQVSIMRDNYNGAQDVLIWLGELNSMQGHDDFDIAGAFHVISQLRAGQHIPDILFFRDSEHASYCSEPKILSAIISLLTRPWWNRAWVVQETVVASHASLACGDFNTEWMISQRRRGYIKSYECCLLYGSLVCPSCRYEKHNFRVHTNDCAVLSASPAISAQQWTTAASMGSS